MPRKRHRERDEEYRKRMAEWRRREYDARGKLAPRYLRRVFHGRRKLMGWVRRLMALKTDLAKLGDEPYCREVDVARTMKTLEAARSLVSRGAPFVPCDCVGTEYGCEKCQGQRWLTIDQVPHVQSTGPL